MFGYNSEADVETKYVYSRILKDVLRISDEQISFHVPVKFNQGREVVRKEADVLIKNLKGENIVVIDSKAPNEALEQYFGQIDSYAFQLETPLSILTNSERVIVRFYQQGNRKNILLDESVKDLEKDGYKKLVDLIESVDKSQEEITNMDIPKEVKPKIIDYRRTFRSIHTKIRSIDKLDPSSAFDEFSKVLFIKIINDELLPEEKLTVEKIEVLGAVKAQAQFIDNWFQEKVNDFYPGIFNTNEGINLSVNALISVLNILNKDFSLKDSMADIKGRAFEEFLPSQLRGKGLGQFFTPRSVVDFMIELADISLNDKVLDFASGSGGFLIKAYEEKKKLINSLPKVYIDALGKTKEQLEEEAKSQIYGIDAEPRAVRTAKMNMLLWGDGKQIQHGNGLDTKDFSGTPYLAKEYDKNDEANTGVDVILANPPFGSTEEDQEILKEYTLSKKKKDDYGRIICQKVKTEYLFVEKAWKMLRPGGRLLIVLPEGIFSNKTSVTRDFILRNFKIDTIIKLPKHAFVMSGVDTINTVILVAYKNNEERAKGIIESDRKTWINKQNSMFVNFASVNQIGYEPSGRIIGSGYLESDFKRIADKLRTNNFETIIEDPIEYAKLEFDDSQRSESWKKSMIKFYRKEFLSVPSRIDPTYYFFQEETKEIMSSFIKLNIKAENVKKIRLTEKELNENVEKVFKFVSVIKTLSGTVTEMEENTVDDILAKKSSSIPQRLYKNDIVFNPYRINTGSVLWINSDEDNLVTSPAYVVLRDIKVDLEYFVQLLKTPFMKYQIQVLATGSVRDNFGIEELKNLRIPNLSLDEQRELIKSVNSSIAKIHECEVQISTHQDNINLLLSSFKNEA